MKRFTYVDPQACINLLGSNILGVPTTHIIEILENYLSSHHMQDYFKALLAHNKQIKNWEFYKERDIGLRFILKTDKNIIERFFKLGTSKPPKWNIDTIDFESAGMSVPKEEKRCVLRIHINLNKGAQWSISLPLQTLLKGYPIINKAHYGYSHSIWLQKQNIEYYYIGITKRNWLIRMKEHLREAFKEDSKKKFHAAWREYVHDEDVVFSSELVVTNHSFKQIMDWEEWAVDKQMDNKRSLNMIPGGFKGLKFLHEHRIINRSDNISIDEREKAIVKYAHQHPKAGIPNLLIAELWEDDDYATAVICGVEGRLSVEQVRLIRKLNADGMADEEILDISKAKNIIQVKNVLSGKTYSRIH